MTVSTTARKADFTLDQVENEFNFTFRALTTAPSDIKCIVTTNGVDKLLTYTTDYTVAVAWDGVGGVVTLVSPSTLSKGTLTVYRDTTNVQGSDYDDYNQFPADTLETDLDRRTMVSQETDEEIARSIKLAITSSLSDIELPAPEANKVIGWNAGANALENKSGNITATLPLLITANVISLPVNSSVSLGTLVVSGNSTFGVVNDLKTLSPVVDVRAYASINAAVTAIGATQTTLVVPNAQTLTASLVIPSTCTLKILQGGSIVKASTYTLTINGTFEAGIYQVFTGFADGNVTFGVDSIKEVSPEWWYVSGSWHTAINLAIASLNPLETSPALAPYPVAAFDTAVYHGGRSGGIVKLSNAVYGTTDTIQMRSLVILRGSGPQSSVIYYTGTGIAIKTGSGVTGNGSNGYWTHHVGLEDFGLQGTTSATDGIFVYGTVRLLMKNLEVQDFDGTGDTVYSSVNWDASTPVSRTITGANAVHFFDFCLFSKVDHVRLARNYTGARSTSVTNNIAPAFQAIDWGGQGEIADNQYGMVIGNPGATTATTTINIASHIHDLVVEANDLGGILIVGGQEINLSNIYMEGNAGFNIRLGDATNIDPYIGSVKNCFISTDIVGIDVVRASNADISNNIIYGNGGTPVSIVLGDVTYSRVKDNRVSGTALSPTDAGTGNVIHSIQNIPGQLTLVNSWANVNSATYNSASSYKDSDGYVHLMGYVSDGIAPSTITTLPAGHRPLRTEIFKTSDLTNGDNIITIASTGVITVTLSDSNTISLDGIIFRVTSPLDDR